MTRMHERMHPGPGTRGSHEESMRRRFYSTYFFKKKIVRQYGAFVYFIGIALTLSPRSGPEGLSKRELARKAVIGYTSEDVDSATQEFRLKATTRSARLQWSAGLFAAHTVMDFDAGTLGYPKYGTSIPAIASLNDDEQRRRGLWRAAICGLTSELSLFPGLRYERGGPGWRQPESSAVYQFDVE